MLGIPLLAQIMRVVRVARLHDRVPLSTSVLPGIGKACFVCVMSRPQLQAGFMVTSGIRYAYQQIPTNINQYDSNIRNNKT